MTITCLNPLLDARWNEFVGRSPAASVFHSLGWVNALQRTYGYEPVAFTDAAPGEALRNALLCCRVSSWMTGRRIVSLPFSDHCDPLVENPEALAALLGSIQESTEPEYRYIELRPRATGVAGRGVDVVAEYWLHVLDLRRDLASIFEAFHASHVRRAIRKAERRGITCEAGRSVALFDEFYDLHVMTRRRHGAPVQPIRWFRQLAACLGDDLTVYVARREGQVHAAIMTVRHKKAVVYKYGGSNPLHKSDGSMPFLFWRIIQDAHADGLEELDLGRSDLDNEGLVAFKDHLGARRTRLRYYRCGKRVGAHATRSLASRLARGAFSLVPPALQASVSSRLYRHFA